MPAPDRRVRPRLRRIVKLWTCLLILTILVALVGGTATTRIHAQSAAARTTSAPVATAINFALAQLGKPYQWGGTGPSSFDCSGLTLRAYQAAGISIPRVSRDQYRAGRHVHLSQLLPGDLIFYTHAEESTVPAGIGHVAMYLGGGRIIEAAHRGVPIRIASLRRPNLVAVATRPAAASPGLPPVQYRQRGSAVSAVQARLTANGACLAVDGVFGPITRRAVLGFQATHGLARDGVLGPHTWDALVSYGRMQSQPRRC
jgi:NlpC/P60 family/Putative peptidoglycan binding domain